MNMNERVKIFDKPFAYVLLTYYADNYCSYCLRKPSDKLLYCSQCRFARYCNKTCQKSAWKEHHKVECTRLKNVFPNLPNSEVFLLVRIVDRLQQIKEKGDIYQCQKERKFDDQETHEEDIRGDDEQMNHFEKLYEKTQKFMGESIPSKDEFFLIFCRTYINCHSIRNSSGIEIGMALDLSFGLYDHSCRPNIVLIFDGYQTIFKPLAPGIDANDWKTSCHAYVDVARSKYQRRKDLQAKWYFWCQCERCADPEDDRLTSIKCSNPSCQEAIIITEDSVPEPKTCSVCSSVVPIETVLEAQTFMKKLPTKFAFSKDEEEMKQIEKYRETAEQLLHPENIYYCRLQTAYMQLSGTRGMAAKPEVQKMIYQNYKRCLPNIDRQVGFQLLILVKALIEQNNRNDAIQYAFEAMTIFEVCFGIQHPFYLQTLALWTFLETKAQKTNEELMSLMNFNYTSPVDISHYLEKVLL